MGNLPQFAKDEEKAKALWDVSEELGGVQFNLAAVADSEIVDASPEESPVEEAEEPDSEVVDSEIVDAGPEESPVEEAEEPDSEEDNTEDPVDAAEEVDGA